MINEAKKNLPKLKQEYREELRKQGLNEELVKLVLSKNKLDEFKELIVIYNKPNLIAKMLILWREEIAKHNNVKIKKVEETYYSAKVKTTRPFTSDTIVLLTRWSPYFCANFDCQSK